MATSLEDIREACSKIDALSFSKLRSMAKQLTEMTAKSEKKFTYKLSRETTKKALCKAFGEFFQAEVPVAQPSPEEILEAAEKSGIDIPETYIDPISLEIMMDPVIVSSGQTLDRKTAKRLLRDPAPRDGNNVPISRAIMIPNKLIKQMIDQFVRDELGFELPAAEKEEKKAVPKKNEKPKQEENSSDDESEEEEVEIIIFSDDDEDEDDSEEREI